VFLIIIIHALYIFLALLLILVLPFKKNEKKIFVKWNLIIQGDQKAVNIFAAKHPNSEVWGWGANQIKSKRNSLKFKNHLLLVNLTIYIKI
jgi:hypothetical protein